ncbi:HAMP domain-containing sensor histidine kinase [Actinoplanes sp. NPDC051470]|uniref:sensor histidine kinase n=1 Tax=unclassified Actinoplanes TaxID=2626549 RepID=UPI00343405D2
MPERPDYAALTRGQIAVLDRISAGEAGLPVLHQIVRLAEEALGGRGAGFAEYAADHGRVIAATGVCAHALGRRVQREERETGDRTLLIPLADVNDEFARQVEGGDLHHMLGARCEASGAVIGSLHVYFGADHEPAPEHHAVLELLASYVGRLYSLRAGLPVHGDGRQEDRDLWVAVTSHELRTPVTVIKGYADTLTNHWGSMAEGERQEAVRIIGARAGELARLVDRLLSATSEDGAGGDNPAGPFDLVEALRAAVDELPGSLRDRVVLGELPTELPKAFGDRDSLATILTELTTNAEKHAPPGSTIELAASADEETVTFRVADRGTGIRPEHVEQAFERYWQADVREQGHRHPGAGLGLYLVRRIVERQHGWVSLRPRRGGGTVAEVRLPRG